MMDINNTEQLERLRNAAINPSGKLIVKFLEQQLEDVSFENIDVSKDDSLVGQEFKKTFGVRKFIKNILDLLTPEKGD